MRRRSVGALLSVGMLAAVLGVGAPNAAARSAAGDPVTPGMLAALQRDLHLTADQATARLAKEDAASRAEQKLRTALGAGFGGAWLARDDQRLIVAITDPKLAGVVRAHGAEPRLVTRSSEQLDMLMTRLDRTPAPASVSSWYVDTPTNTVVVRVRPGGLAAARAFVRGAGVDVGAVRVETAAARAVPLIDVSGGDYFRNNQFGAPCSVGFSVVGGFVTAGHCVDAGGRALGRDPDQPASLVDMGAVAGWTYPGRDYGWVDVTADWTPRPWVDYYSTYLFVYNANVAAEGASVCRSGWATGWRCGTIEARNVTVNQDGNTVSQLTRTSACANHGDSGGPFVSGGQAQGVLTSGEDRGLHCNADTFFQPVRPILARYGLNLLVVGGSLPTITGMSCQYYGSNTLGCGVGHVTQGPAEIRWKVGGVARPAWNNRTSGSGSCSGAITTVSVTVSAAISKTTASWTETRTVHCTGTPP